jgi:hypothetical protein
MRHLPTWLLVPCWPRRLRDAGNAPFAASRSAKPSPRRSIFIRRGPELQQLTATAMNAIYGPSSRVALIRQPHPGLRQRSTCEPGRRRAPRLGGAVAGAVIGAASVRTMRPAVRRRRTGGRGHWRGAERQRAAKRDAVARREINGWSGAQAIIVAPSAPAWKGAAMRSNSSLASEES